MSPMQILFSVNFMTYDLTAKWIFNAFSSTLTEIIVNIYIILEENITVYLTIKNE